LEGDRKKNESTKELRWQTMQKDDNDHTERITTHVSEYNLLNKLDANFDAFSIQ
jgi:hypothetical protein